MIVSNARRPVFRLVLHATISPPATDFLLLTVATLEGLILLHASSDSELVSKGRSAAGLVREASQHKILALLRLPLYMRQIDLNQSSTRRF